MKYVYSIRKEDIKLESYSCTLPCTQSIEGINVSILNLDDYSLTELNVEELYNIFQNENIEGCKIDKDNFFGSDCFNIKVAICSSEKEEISKLIKGKLLGLELTLDGTLRRISKKMIKDGVLTIPENTIRFADNLLLDKNIPDDILSSVQTIEIPKSSITCVSSIYASKGLFNPESNCTPLYPYLGVDNIDYIINAIRVRTGNVNVKKLLIHSSFIITYICCNGVDYDIESTEMIDVEDFERNMNSDYLPQNFIGKVVFSDSKKQIIIDKDNKKVIRRHK